MTTENAPSRKRPPRWLVRGRLIAERLGMHHFHRVVAMLLATATLVIAVVTYLEVEAHSNSEGANASAQLKQIQASTLEINGKAQVNFDYTSAYRTWLELEYQALSA